MKNKVKTNQNYKNCLHCLIKEISQQKGRKLKIVCDWDEVIQTRNSYLHYQNLQKNSPSSLPFSNEYLKVFWKERWVSYDEQSCYFTNESLREEIAKIRNNSDAYVKQPFLSPAKELLLALKDELIEKLIFLSAYNHDNMPCGDQRKINKFQVTFENFPQCKFELFPFSPQKESNFFKWQSIQQHNSDFDLFIDDNPNIIKSAQENLPSDKLFALPDYYEHNEHVKGFNVYHFKVGLSTLQDEDFAKSAQEYQVKQMEVSPK